MRIQNEMNKEMNKSELSTQIYYTEEQIKRKQQCSKNIPFFLLAVYRESLIKCKANLLNTKRYRNRYPISFIRQFNLIVSF